MSFQKTTPEVIRDILRENLSTDYFKEFFIGDNMDIPISMMPCVVIEQTDSRHELGATGMENIYETFTIKLIINKRDEFGKSPDESPGSLSLKRYAEGLDETTGQVSSDSVLGVLRKYFTMGNTILNQEVTVQYGVVPRPNESVTDEAHITITTERLVTITNRQ